MRCGRAPVRLSQYPSLQSSEFWCRPTIMAECCAVLLSTEAKFRAPRGGYAVARRGRPYLVQGRNCLEDNQGGAGRLGRSPQRTSSCLR